MNRKAKRAAEIRLRIYIRHALSLANAGLSSKVNKEIENKTIDGFGICADVFEEFSEESGKANEILEELEQEILSTFDPVDIQPVKRPANLKMEKVVKSHIQNVLNVAGLNLSNEEMGRVEDQMLGIFRDYANAPDEIREEIYTRGEERVLSIFDPPGQSKGAASNNRAASATGE